MAKPDPDRHITRANYLDVNGKPASGGFMVRFQRRGKNHQSYFGDLRYGGKKHALAAARAHRDQIEPKFRTLTPVERAKLLTASNTSGTVGVRWVTKEIVRGDKKYSFLFACAAWSINGKRRSKSFSTEKYGKEKAWDLALKARKAGLKEMAEATAK